MFQPLRRIVATDLYRHAGVASAAAFRHHYCWNPGFHYTFLLRLYAYLRDETRWGRFGFRQLVAYRLYRCSLRYGISISGDTRIGSGFYIGHFGGIVVNTGVVIGNNCNISQGVTIGQSNRGTKAGCPTIGDNVYIGPGAKVVGRIHVGNDAAIGANAVVVDDVPAGVAVGGVPARVISDQGSQGYVNRTDYPPVT